MSSDMECPYCYADQEVCHDDGQGYSEEERHEHTCSNCGKTFVFRTVINFEYYPEKADCLNGEPHELKMSSTYPREFAHMGCKNCDYRRNPTSEEIAEDLILRGKND